MCTVSFYKNSNTIIITSNRDEHINRHNSSAPQKKKYGGKYLFYPEDKAKKGTWFCVNESNEIVVLLNGANKKHVSKMYYRKSRGLVVLDLFVKNSIVQSWNAYDLSDIEPFTLIAYTQNHLYQFQWNGAEKSTILLNSDDPFIWSSSTLYSQAVKQQRKDWFMSFIQSKKNQTSDDILYFHTNSHSHDKTNGLIINRGNTIMSKSVTQCILSPTEMKMIHIDLINHSRTILCNTPN